MCILFCTCIIFYHIYAFMHSLPLFKSLDRYVPSVIERTLPAKLIVFLIVIGIMRQPNCCGTTRRHLASLSEGFLKIYFLSQSGGKISEISAAPLNLIAVVYLWEVTGLLINCNDAAIIQIAAEKLRSSRAFVSPRFRLTFLHPQMCLHLFVYIQIVF